MDAGGQRPSLEQLLDRLEALGQTMRSYADAVLITETREPAPTLDHEPTTLSR